MATRTNKRIIYAQQAIALSPDATAVNVSKQAGDIAFGVQELGIATNFRNTPYFELGQLEIYEDVEELPDVELTLSKALDGRPLLYHLATSISNGSSGISGSRNNLTFPITIPGEQPFPFKIVPEIKLLFNVSVSFTGRESLIEI